VRQEPPRVPAATQVPIVAPEGMTQVEPVAQMVLVVLHMPPAITRVRQMPEPVVEEHCRPMSQRLVMPSRQLPLRAPSATQVPIMAPVGVTQREPVAQELAAPVGSHMPPGITVAISVTESSNAPCAVLPEMGWRALLR